MGRRSLTLALFAAAIATLVAAPSAALAARHVLAYAQGSHIWVSAPNGSHPKRLGVAGDQVVISPDGRQVATVLEGPFERNIPSHLTVYSVSGGSGRNYLDTEYKPTPTLAGIVGFSPDSRYLAVRTTNDIDVLDLSTGMIVATLSGSVSGSWSPKLPDRFVNVGFAPASPTTIWSPGAATRQLLPRNAEYPIWGPTIIAFERDEQIWTINPDGSGLKRLTNVHSTSLSQPFTGMEPEFFSPNSREIVAFYSSDTTGHACLVSLRTGKQTPIVVLGNYVSPIAFDASGTRLLVGFGPTDYAPPGYADRIATITLSGTGIQTIVKDAGLPSWNF